MNTWGWDGIQDYSLEYVNALRVFYFFRLLHKGSLPISDLESKSK